MPDHRRLQSELNVANLEIRRLRDENQQLKDALAKYSAAVSAGPAIQTRRLTVLPTIADIANVAAPTDNDSKISLFRRLFRGREDVYAERWRMKDGTWAYCPAGRKNWDALRESSPDNRKRIDRETRILFPLTDEVVRCSQIRPQFS